MSVREIPGAIEIEVDNIFGDDPEDQERRFRLAFHAINGWDLDQIKAMRENKSAQARRSIAGWVSIG